MSKRNYKGRRFKIQVEGKVFDERRTFKAAAIIIRKLVKNKVEQITLLDAAEQKLMDITDLTRGFRKDARFYTHDGVTLTLSQWCERLGMKRSALKNRIHKGWSFDRVFKAEVSSGPTRREIQRERQKPAMSIFNAWALSRAIETEDA